MLKVVIMEAGSCIDFNDFAACLLEPLANIRCNYIYARESDADQLSRPTSSLDNGLRYLVRNRQIFFRHVIVGNALEDDSLAVWRHRAP